MQQCSQNEREHYFVSFKCLIDLFGVVSNLFFISATSFLDICPILVFPIINFGIVISAHAPPHQRIHVNQTVPGGDECNKLYIFHHGTINNRDHTTWVFFVMSFRLTPLWLWLCTEGFDLSHCLRQRLAILAGILCLILV